MARAKLVLQYSHLIGVFDSLLACKEGSFVTINAMGRISWSKDGMNWTVDNVPDLGLTVRTLVADRHSLVALTTQGDLL